MQRVLVVDDNETIRQGMHKSLSKAGFEVAAATNADEAIDQIKSFDPGCVITDLKMSGLGGVELMQAIHKIKANTPVIIITAFGTIEKAVEAMKLGANDFVTKPFSPELLRVKVQKAFQMNDLTETTERLQAENLYLKNQTGSGYQTDELKGDSKAIHDVCDQIANVAKTDTTVFINGESGTGKELAARALHRFSDRHDGPFIKINCNALPEGLLESELFGHERGAFTGAIKQKLGRFELADRGTIFLDEIGDISESVQLKLLRVLQEKEFERLGGTKTIKVNVRIVSATNQDLKKKVNEGRFREDLYYRLVIVPIQMPALRDRLEDLEILIDHFLQQLQVRHGRGKKSMSDGSLQQLRNYHWPGNVRELRNLIEQLYILSPGETIEIGNLPDFLKKSGDYASLKVGLGEKSLTEILETTELELLKQAWSQTGGVKAKMARLLGIKPSALYYKLEKFGLIP